MGSLKVNEMHRAYQPITAANNKLLKKRWDQRTYDLHRAKVHTSKAMIDNHAPETYMHMHLKLKKLQMEEERLAVVERDNRILLEKMSYIMRTKGLVDNWNNYTQKSLNKTKRQRELLRVAHENQAILKRISSKEPHYNHMIWDDEWKRNLHYMSNIACYPQRWNSSIKNSQIESTKIQTSSTQENRGEKAKLKPKSKKA